MHFIFHISTDTQSSYAFYFSHLLGSQLSVSARQTEGSIAYAVSSIQPSGRGRSDSSSHPRAGRESAHSAQKSAAIQTAACHRFGIQRNAALAAGPLRVRHRGARQRALREAGDGRWIRSHARGQDLETERSCASRISGGCSG